MTASSHGCLTMLAIFKLSRTLFPNFTEERTRELTESEFRTQNKISTHLGRVVWLAALMMENLDREIKQFLIFYFMSLSDVPNLWVPLVLLGFIVIAAIFFSRIS
jgi:hypothetical protein